MPPAEINIGLSTIQPSCVVRNLSLSVFMDSSMSMTDQVLKPIICKSALLQIRQIGQATFKDSFV